MRNMKQVKRVVAILMFAALPWGVTLAQETASSINGTIVDSSGNALSGATVIVTILKSEAADIQMLKKAIYSSS